MSLRQWCVLAIITFISSCWKVLFCLTAKQMTPSMLICAVIRSELPCECVWVIKAVFSRGAKTRVHPLQPVWRISFPPEKHGREYTRPAGCRYGEPIHHISTLCWVWQPCRYAAAATAPTMITKINVYPSCQGLKSSSSAEFSRSDLFERPEEQILFLSTRELASKLDCWDS